jgi:tRNA1(Val) A37 N6-methylase TrmN6
MIRRPILSLVAVGIALSSTAFAQDEDESDREVRYKSRTEIDFEGVDVSGELLKPQGSLLLERRKASFNPLIKLRANFNAEMKESINEVK